jgi:hypothetical protein
MSSPTTAPPRQKAKRLSLEYNPNAPIARAQITAPVEACYMLAMGCPEGIARDRRIFDGRQLSDEARITLGHSLLDHICRNYGQTWYWYAEEMRKVFADCWRKQGQFKLSIFDVYKGASR